MDYQEVRFERLEHWNCPVVGVHSVGDEHRDIAKRILNEIKEEAEAINRRQSLMHLLPTEVLMQSAGSPTNGGGGGRMGRRRSSSYQESRKKLRQKKAMTAKDSFIRSVLTKIIDKKKNKATSQKRASIIMNDDNANAAFMELFDDGKKAAEEEDRKKRIQVRKIVENMRLVLRTANDSKTRGGKVIYGHLYGELKQRERERGMSFHETDTSLGEFASKKLQEEKEERRKWRIMERMKREEEHKIRKDMLREKYDDNYVDEPIQAIDNDGEEKKLAEEKEEVQDLDSFFITTRPKTPQFEYNLGDMFDNSSVGSVGSMGSTGSTWTKRDETDKEAMGRIGERIETTELKIEQEDRIDGTLGGRRRRKNSPSKTRMGKRMSLVALQTEFSRRSSHSMTADKKHELMEMKNRSIANATHFGTYTRTEVMELAELLYTMDVDGDGTIAASEFEHYIKKGKYGQTFAHLQFEVMDTDKSGEITPKEIIALVFHKASVFEQKRIGVAIGSEMKRRRELLEKHRTNKPKYHRISSRNMESAAALFNFFDVKKKGRVKLEDFAKVLRSEDGMGAVLVPQDVTEMLGGVAKKGYVDLDGWVMYSYDFRGPYEVVDSKTGEVFERRNEE
jgi:Ca2+-binding EF-hand superfamily protein